MEFEKQHYLSQFYLKGFGKCNPNPKSEAMQNWVYFMHEKKIKLKEPQNFAYKSYLYSKINENNNYDHTLEKYFGDIENEVVSLIKDITNKVKKWNNTHNDFKFEMKEKILLILFAFWSIKKTPSIKEKLKEEILTKIKEDLGDYYSHYSSEISKFANNSSIDLITNLDGKNDLNMFEILFNKNIHFIISANDSSFITTDNPVVVYNSKGSNGIIYNSSEIYFPLNHEILLMLHENGKEVKIFKVPSKKKQRELNNYIALNANEIIISKDKEYLIRILKDIKYEYA